MSIRVSIPLAGMDPASQQLRDERDRLGDEDRGFRMLSEGELFYVDTDLPQCGDERLLGACRHDHGHLGGVSLEEITQSMATRNPGKASLRKPESIAETEAASRSSSQDSSHNTDNSWQHQQRKGSNPVSNVRSGHQQQQQQQQQHQQRRQQQSPMFLKHKQGWDYSKLEAFLPGNDEGRERECSFSESNVRNCTRQLMLPTGEDYGCGPRRGGLKNPPDWSLSCIIGGSRVEVECLHLTSCTSTKTFEILPTDRESDALRRLGVVPDGFSSGVDGAGSMTFMMHIAGHRWDETQLTLLFCLGVLLSCPSCCCSKNALRKSKAPQSFCQ